MKHNMQAHMTNGHGVYKQTDYSLNFFVFGANERFDILMS